MTATLQGIFRFTISICN